VRWMTREATAHSSTGGDIQWRPSGTVATLRGSTRCADMTHWHPSRCLVAYREVESAMPSLKGVEVEA
jgi:hypothetical protein